MLTDSSETLLRIVTNLLDLSSMELDRFQMDPVIVDIRNDLDRLSPSVRRPGSLQRLGLHVARS